MFLHLGLNNGAQSNHSGRMHLIDEQTSPLQRIMWVYNVNDPMRRFFDNNICAFHVGGGYFLSVAHNLRLQAGFFRSIDLGLYQREIYAKLDGNQNRFMEQHFFTDDYAQKKFLTSADPAVLQQISAILKQKRFDTRWVTLAEKRVCDSFLVFQFRSPSFYNNDEATALFLPEHVMYDNDAHKYTYLVPVVLEEAYYSADIALYKIVNTPKEIIDCIPSVDMNFDFLDEDAGRLFCLQSSPSGPTGRMVNEAHIEGMLDHFGIFQDDVAGNYLFEGYRYLIKGYFRFGSSGAPYLRFMEESGRYVANAVQSEASGIQLSIKNDREGNFQYVNAIASPLYIIKEQLLNKGVIS